MLNSHLAAVTAQFLQPSEKCRLLVSCRGLQPALVEHMAWEPLVLGTLSLQCLLRRLKESWKLSTFTASVMQGLCGVHELEVDVSSLDIGSLPVTEQWCHCLLPFQDFLTQLQLRFTHVRHLKVTNISDLEVDINSRFLKHRCSLLSDFAIVRLSPTWLAPAESYDCHRAKYVLTATRTFYKDRHEHATNGQEVGEGREHTKNKLPNCQECCFEEEHTSVYKGSSGSFHVRHAPQRTFAEDDVRQQYQKLFAALAS